MTRRALLGLVALVALSGCVGLAPAEAPGDDNRIGWENGYAYDDPLNVTTGDGLNATEREAVLARTMARIEHLRDLEFREPVTIELVSREEYRTNRSSDPNATHADWNNQVWKGLLLVGADADVHEVFDETLGSRVIGFYTPGSGEITLITDGPTPRVSRGTLVHELVHALQDQQFGIEGQPDTQDRQLARNAVVEGEANRIQRQYTERCDEEWSCIPPTGGGGGGGSLGPYGEQVFTVIYHPYAAGPVFIRTIDERGGTDALDDLYEPYPASTEQIIHPEAYPDERPVNVTVPDRSRGDWRRFDHDPVADTVGEASIFVMALTHDLGDANVGRFSYRHPVSVGWAGDSLVPYRDGDRFGYVWTTAWDTGADAREFHAAYRELMRTQGAEALSGDRYRLPEDHPFGGAYRLSIDGSRVTVVHGPTRASLSSIHPP